MKVYECPCGNQIEHEPQAYEKCSVCGRYNEWVTEGGTQ